jgi:hypothetical protein
MYSFWHAITLCGTIGPACAQVSRQSFTWYRPVFDLSWHQAATWPNWKIAVMQTQRYQNRSPQLISPQTIFASQVHWMALNFAEILDGLTSPDGLSELLPLQAPPVPTHFATLEGLKAPGTEQQDSVRHADFKIFQPAISGYVNGLRPVLRCLNETGASKRRSKRSGAWKKRLVTIQKELNDNKCFSSLGQSYTIQLLCFEILYYLCHLCHWIHLFGCFFCWPSSYPPRSKAWCWDLGEGPSSWTSCLGGPSDLPAVHEKCCFPTQELALCRRDMWWSYMIWQ